MNINYSKGSSPGGICRYLLNEQKQKQAEQNPILETNMSGRDAEELAEEFRFSHDLNRRVEQTMVHYSVSLPAGEKVQDEEIGQISRGLLEKTGHGDCQYFVVRHHDREQHNDVTHWHVLTSAVDLKGQWVDDSFIKLRLKTVERELEQSFHLSQRDVREERERQNLTTGEYRLRERTGKELPKEKLWQTIQTHASDRPSMTDLTTRLKAEGVAVQFRTREGQVQGISYEIEGVAFPGYKLGKAYSFTGLQKHLGVSHSPNQDEQLRQVSSMTTDQCREWLQRQMEMEVSRERKRDRQSQEPLTFPTQQMEAIDNIQHDRAHQILPIALAVWERRHANGDTREVAAGRWQLEGQRYTAVYDQPTQTFSLSAMDGRGELLRHRYDRDEERGVLEQAQGLQPQDVTAFYEMQRLMQQVEEEEQQRDRGMER